MVDLKQAFQPIGEVMWHFSLNMIYFFAGGMIEQIETRFFPISNFPVPSPVINLLRVT